MAGDEIHWLNSTVLTSEHFCYKSAVRVLMHMLRVKILLYLALYSLQVREF